MVIDVIVNRLDIPLSRQRFHALVNTAHSDNRQRGTESVTAQESNIFVGYPGEVNRLH
jgi:hypothetical protein